MTTSRIPSPNKTEKSPARPPRSPGPQVPRSPGPQVPMFPDHRKVGHLQSEIGIRMDILWVEEMLQHLMGETLRIIWDFATIHRSLDGIVGPHCQYYNPRII